MKENYQPILQSLPLRERPDYRVTNNADACNLAELLSVLIGGENQIESANAMLAKFGTIQRLAAAHPYEIVRAAKISKTSAARILAALSLGRKFFEVDQSESMIIHSPADGAAILRPMMENRQVEYVYILCLDSRNKVLEAYELYKGSMNSAQMRIGELFKHAIALNSASIIVAHNHPSGDPAPSPEDIAFTRAVVQAGKLMDIAVLDHLILGNGGRFVSLKEKGLGF